MTFALRPHQTESVDAILNTLDAHPRALLVSACGTGKTITLHEVMQRRNSQRTAAFFPSLALVEQTISAWGRQSERGFRAVVVCSDDTVVERYNKAKADDEVTVSDDELAAHGAQVIRSVPELADILTSHDPCTPLVVFSTYQSSDKVAEAQRRTGVRFDLAIADEAHKLATPANARKGAGRTGAVVLNDNGILADKRVFATATPRTFTYSATTESHRAHEASMDNPDIFGPVAHTVGLRDAIDLGLLTPYKIHILGVSLNDLPEAVDTNTNDAHVRMLMGLVALERAITTKGVTRVIAYLGNRQRANQFARLVNEHGIADCSVITGDMPTSARTPKLEALADGGVIANVRCLTEGVDIPAVDGVLFVDPRTSKVDIVQAVGRAIRLNPGKDLGHVILPVLHDQDDHENFGLDTDSFTGVWDVLQQMAENDTALHQAMQELSDTAARGGERQEADTLASTLDVDFGLATAQARTLWAAFTLHGSRLNDSLSAQWRERLYELSTFVRTHKRTPRAKAPSTDERRLGTWLGSQRTLMNQGALREDRAALLREIPGALVERVDLDAAWESTCGELSAFVQKHGRVPSSLSQDADEKRLITWLTTQRTRNKRGLLRFDREKLLRAIPGALEVQDLDAAWVTTCEQLGAFFGREKRAPKSTSADKEEKRLAFWWNAQRTLQRKGRLRPDRETLLNETASAFNAKVDLESAWADSYEQLRVFTNLNGHIPGSASSDPSERRIYRWVSTQRSLEKQGTLRPDRAALLREIPGVFVDPVDREAVWASTCTELGTFVRTHGRVASLSTGNETEKRLGHWVATQRKSSRAGTLRPDREVLLRKIPGVLTKV